jgi:hypothetical protein
MLIIRHDDGSLRFAGDRECVNLREGEEMLAKIPDGLMAKDMPEALFSEGNYLKGIKWGDVIAWTTKKMGIQPCGACKTRQFLLNHIHELGLMTTLREIKKTLP